MSKVATDAECAGILVAAGLELGERSFDNSSAVSDILMRTTQSPRAIPEIKMFMHSHGGFDEISDDDGSAWMLLNYASRVWDALSLLSELHPNFSWTFDRIFSGYHKLPFVTRTRELFANLGPQYGHEIPPDIFRLSLWADGKIRQGDIDQLRDCDIPFMNIVSACIGFRFWCKSACPPVEWQETFQEVLDITGDLHSFRHDAVPDGTDFWYLRHRTTPLICYLLGAAAKMYILQDFKTVIQHALIGWLSLLERCKVDLVKYGRRERKALRSNHTLMEVRMEQLLQKRHERRGPEHLKLKDIRYGRKLEDWSLVWDLDVEEFAMEFWQMTEEPRYPVPGAWVDD